MARLQFSGKVLSGRSVCFFHNWTEWSEPAVALIDLNDRRHGVSLIERTCYRCQMWQIRKAPAAVALVKDLEGEKDEN